MQDVNYCQEPAISNRMTASRNKRTLEWPVWDVCARPLTAISGHRKPRQEGGVSPNSEQVFPVSRSPTVNAYAESIRQLTATARERLLARRHSR
jgi:hypothetical protein